MLIGFSLYQSLLSAQCGRHVETINRYSACSTLLYRNNFTLISKQL